MDALLRDLRFALRPYVVVAAGLAAAAMITMMVPARRAAVVTPAQYLRSE
jgi:hypothetical protein